ncbi:mitochondrial inner membrane protease ATP23 [Rhizophagus clarus]|uniref:Mitochondrial inner membrane protease ATP23 n=1 Tax=Rhizophagus clarus TaxID=94130 RepID=A0A8H3QDM2_9GLOM|nr:mitochondrial inner membrane protease ATP23 [Rhizophagus clarus]
MEKDPIEEKSREQKNFDKWRKSLMYITGLGLSIEDKKKIETELEKDFEDYQCKRCEKWRDMLMRNSPIVTFMLKSLEEAGCKIDKRHLQCKPCDESRSGGFSPDHGILLCQNRFKVDWNNCLHHACSEIRAASLSGDCRWTRELRRGFFNFTKQHQVCTKRRAILSVKQNDACSAPGVAERAVAEVFESCFNDTQPFDEIY